MSEKQYISLFQLQSIIKHRLEKEMPLSCWVTAEISELKVNYSGHCYLELVEKGGKNQVPKARVSAIIWRSSFGAIESFFRTSTGAELGEGMNVLLSVRVNYHELYGLSLIVNDIDPLYTLGDMQRQRQETIDRLKEDGVFEMNRSLELPPIIQRIAIISSRNAAGYQDFINEISSSPYRFELTLFDSFMQGAGAEDSVVSALELVVDSLDKFDVVVVIRGGGSQSDLAAFDSYRLTSHLAQFPLPIITGIGHDKDESVADLVAAVALKTPTAVATWLVEQLGAFDGWLEQLNKQVVDHAEALVKGRRQQLQRAAYRLSREAVGMTRSLEMRLERLGSRLKANQSRMILHQSNQLDRLMESVEMGQSRVVERSVRQIERTDVELRQRVEAMVSAESARLNMVDKLTHSRDPRNILSLGFAIVRSGGRALKDSTVANVGDTLDIGLSKGALRANITEKIEE